MGLPRLFLALTVLVSATFLVSACHVANHHKRIGVIVPIENKALDEIVTGFTETLHEKNKDIDINVQNAQGDLNLERAIISQMNTEGVLIVAPIGTDATEMTLAMIHDKPIVSLASNLSEKDRQKQKPCNVVAVHDEIPPQQIIQFVHAVYPKLTQLTLIYSASNKIYPQVQEVIDEGKKLGITVTATMAPTLNDLYSVSNNIPKNAQGILVLKDILIISGITTIEHSANKMGIPLMTSDQGSVQDGADFALGVHEKQIGEEGGKLANAILAGKTACSLPLIDMTHLTVFINQEALERAKQSTAPILAAAKNFNYPTQFVNQGGTHA